LNQCLMKLRKQHQAREVSIDKDFQSEEENLPIDVADWAPDPEKRYRAAELREILSDTLQELTPALRVVFVMRDMEGLSLDQTAAALGLSLPAVKARSARARLQLRERLSPYFKKAEASANVEPRTGYAQPADLERPTIGRNSYIGLGRV
jgi:RNA polymerase sigma-70 factor (ECF subfamily)